MSISLEERGSPRLLELPDRAVAFAISRLVLLAREGRAGGCALGAPSRLLEEVARRELSSSALPAPACRGTEAAAA